MSAAAVAPAPASRRLATASPPSLSAPSWLDHALFPAFLLLPQLAGAALLARDVPNLLVTPLVVGPLVAITWLLERVRPERPWSGPRETPLWLEAAHFLFNFEVGYGLGLLALGGLERALRVATPSVWPSAWPMAAQLLLAVLLYEATSYWQHRLLHERERLWRFHALHHHGAELDLFRAARFHLVDFATVSFLAFLPLVVLGVTDDVITHLAILVSALGLAHHANMRVRTPAWLDRLICTPAVHRRHHSAVRAESDCNYANTVMLFDRLFGTWGPPDPVGPATVGMEGPPLRDGFRAQLLDPFRTP